MTQKNFAFKFATIVAVCCLLTGAVALELLSFKVLRTSAKMFVLRDNARFYNEQSVKTDKMTAEDVENQKMLDEFYNSDDFIVRTFAKSPSIIKVFWTLLAYVFLIGIPVTFVILLIWWKNVKDENWRVKFTLTRQAKKLENAEEREAEYLDLISILGK